MAAGGGHWKAGHFLAAGSAGRRVGSSGELAQPGDYVMEVGNPRSLGKVKTIGTFGKARLLVTEDRRYLVPGMSKIVSVARPALVSSKAR